MTESTEGGFRFRICKAKGCRNGTTMAGGVCSLCRRSGGGEPPPRASAAKTVGMNASPSPHIDKMPAGGQR